MKHCVIKQRAGARRIFNYWIDIKPIVISIVETYYVSLYKKVVVSVMNSSINAQTYKCQRIIDNDNVLRINIKIKLKINNWHSVEKKLLENLAVRGTTNYCDCLRVCSANVTVFTTFEKCVRS